MESHYLYKIISTYQWQKSLQQNRVVSTSLDSAFIHLATEEQLPRVLEKFWNGQECIILKLAVEKLVGRLVFETNPNGITKFPHLYEGYIPFEAIIDATKA